jgi:hypothetical protein
MKFLRVLQLVRAQYNTPRKLAIKLLMICQHFWEHLFKIKNDAKQTSKASFKSVDSYTDNPPAKTSLVSSNKKKFK